MPSWEPTEEQPALSDKDESAVAGLLALGMNESSMDLSDFSIVKPSLPALPQAFSPRVQDETSSTETQALLRHYRYEIAPWVGMPENDYRRHFTDWENVVGYMRFRSIIWHKCPSIGDGLSVRVEFDNRPLRNLL